MIGSVLSRMRVAGAIAVAAAVGVLTGCKGSPAADLPVPRQYAYPRIQVPEALYRQDTIGSVAVAVNASAVTDSPEAGWLTATYPGLDAEIYFTLTPLTADNAESLIANRVERLSMNTGGAPTEVVETVNPNAWECTLLVTPSGSPTPVQFLAVEPGKWMLSGSAMIAGATSAPKDSIRPTVDMLRRDITHLLNTL